MQHHLDHGDVQGTCNGEADTDNNKDQSSSSNTGDKDQSSSQQPQNTTYTTTYQSTGGTKTTTTQQTTTQQTTTQQTATQQTTTPQTTSQQSVDTGVGTQSSGGYQAADLSNIRSNSAQNTTTVTPQNDPEPAERKVYGTVKATVHVFNKSLTSRGILDFKIIDAHNQRVLTQEKMPGEFVWYTEWGYFNGDERALDDYFLEIVKMKEAYPPPPQDLFVAFTQPIFGQVTGKIRDFYRGY